MKKIETGLKWVLQTEPFEAGIKFPNPTPLTRRSLDQMTEGSREAEAVLGLARKIQRGPEQEGGLP